MNQTLALVGIILCLVAFGFLMVSATQADNYRQELENEVVACDAYRNWVEIYCEFPTEEELNRICPKGN